MDYLQPPDPFVKKTAHFVDAFCEVAAAQGDSRQKAEALFRQLPNDVKFAPAFLDALGGMWRYSYGGEFDRLPEDTVAFGTTQFPEVSNLFVGLRAAQSHLSSDNLLRFLARLENPDKHQDTLFELAPLVRLPENISVEFEPDGIGEGNRKIDWLIKAPDNVPIAVEVKYRIRDLIDHLTLILPGVNEGRRDAGGGPGDPAPLFRDTTEKFQRCSPETRLQGAWIHPHIKILKDELHEYFASLDDQRLHFALLAGWEGEGYPLARTTAIEGQVLNIFGLKRTDRYVV